MYKPKSMTKTSIYTVVMAGGSGTRFWPLSRRALPKQFLPLVTRRSMLVETVARMRAVLPQSGVRVVCGPEHARLVHRSLASLPKHHVFVEPEARNTAPAIALAVAQLPEEAVVVVVPSDQHVIDIDTFGSCLSRAVTASHTGKIVTLGIRPSRPETGFGYIEMGRPFKNAVNAVARFVEKPDLPKAKSYLRQKKYLWNAGIFVFQVGVMREALRQHQPDIGKPMDALIAAAQKGPLHRQVVATQFRQMPSISIDYAVAEKAGNMAVVACDCGWSDVGSFPALAEVRDRDESGNVAVGKRVQLVNVKNSVVWSDARTVAVVGLEDIVVIDTPDAVLVMHKNASQDVRKVVEALKEKKQLRVL
jgi:mannose-1-phosphate guanylyltransferase